MNCQWFYWSFFIGFFLLLKVCTICPCMLIPWFNLYFDSFKILLIYISTLWPYAASLIYQRPIRLKNIQKSENHPERKWNKCAGCIWRSFNVVYTYLQAIFCTSFCTVGTVHKNIPPLKQVPPPVNIKYYHSLCTVYSPLFKLMLFTLCTSLLHFICIYTLKENTLAK